MSWAFILFLMVFLCLMLAQILLSWLASTPGIKYPKSLFKVLAQPLLSLCLLFGCLFTVAAAVLLLLSLYRIQYAPIASGISTTAISFTKLVRTAFWLAAAFFPFGVLFLSCSHLVLFFSNSWKKTRRDYLMNAVDIGQCFSLIIFQLLLIWHRT